MRAPVQNSDTFGSIVASGTFKIDQRLACDDKCLVYLFTCKTCSRQYTGETTDQFRLTLDHYKSNEWKFKRGKQCMQEHLYEHFYSDVHYGFLVAITLIDKTDNKDLKIGKTNGWQLWKSYHQMDEDWVCANTVCTTYYNI